MSTVDDLKIDKNNLETEWEKQSHLYNFYSAELAKAIEEQQVAKDLVELEEATLDKDIRTFPEKYEIEGKLTDKKVEKTVQLQPEYRQAKKKMIETNKTMNVHKGILSAFDHKKSALENLTKLFLSNYYAEPYITGKAKEAIVEDKDMGGEAEVFTKRRRR